MIEENDAPARSADAVHFLRDLDRIRDDADQIRRVDDVEGTVGELQIGGIHLQQADATNILARHALARLFEHRRREVDARHVTVRGIEREIDSRADTDLQHPLAGLDVHALDRLQSARVERRSEDQVVNLRELVVDTLDEVVFDGGHRQCAGAGVTAGDEIFFLSNRAIPRRRLILMVE